MTKDVSDIVFIVSQLTIFCEDDFLRLRYADALREIAGTRQ